MPWLDVSLYNQARTFSLDQKIKVFAETGLRIWLPKALGKDMPPNAW